MFFSWFHKWLYSSEKPLFLPCHTSTPASSSSMANTSSCSQPTFNRCVHNTIYTPWGQILNWVIIFVKSRGQGISLNHSTMSGLCCTSRSGGKDQLNRFHGQIQVWTHAQFVMMQSKTKGVLNIDVTFPQKNALKNTLQNLLTQQGSCQSWCQGLEPPTFP